MTLEEWIERFNDRVRDLAYGKEGGPLQRAHARGDSPEFVAEMAVSAIDSDVEDDDEPDDDGLDEFRAVWQDDES